MSFEEFSSKKIAMSQPIQRPKLGAIGRYPTLYTEDHGWVSLSSLVWPLNLMLSVTSPGWCRRDRVCQTSLTPPSSPEFVPSSPTGARTVAEVRGVFKVKKRGHFKMCKMIQQCKEIVFHFFYLALFPYPPTHNCRMFNNICWYCAFVLKISVDQKIKV